MLECNRAADSFLNQDDALSVECGRILFGDFSQAKELMKQCFSHHTPRSARTSFLRFCITESNISVIWSGHSGTALKFPIESFQL